MAGGLGVLVAETGIGRIIFMSKNTRTLTLSALFSAFSIIILYFASIWPTGQVGLVAVASLFTAAAVIETGLFSGIYVYIVCSALGLILLPDKTAAFIYVLFFGYYPVIKSLIERIRGTVIQWVLKLLVFNTALTVVFLLFREMIPVTEGSIPGTLIVIVVGSIVFALFDYGFTKLIWLYINQIAKFRNKGQR